MILSAQQVYFLTSDIFPRNSLILITPRIKKRTTSPLSERCLDPVSNGGLLQLFGPAGFARLFRQHGPIRRLVR